MCCHTQGSCRQDNRVIAKEEKEEEITSVNQKNLTKKRSKGFVWSLNRSR
jgi:hypothetical protein